MIDFMRLRNFITAFAIAVLIGFSSEFINARILHWWVYPPGNLPAIALIWISLGIICGYLSSTGRRVGYAVFGWGIASETINMVAGYPLWSFTSNLAVFATYLGWVAVAVLLDRLIR